MHSRGTRCIIPYMKPSIQIMFKQLKEFGSESNFDLAKKLDDISETTEDDVERDQAIDLMLFCEANENGPLGMDSLQAIASRFNNMNEDNT